MKNAQRVSLRLARIQAYRESAMTVGGHDVDWLLEQLAAERERADRLQDVVDAARFKHLVANGVGWSDGSPHLTRRDSALRDIDKTRAEIDKAMAAQEKAKHPAGGAE